MEDYIVALISAVASFIAAYLGACLALKNVKKKNILKNENDYIMNWLGYYLLQMNL